MQSMLRRAEEALSCVRVRFFELQTTHNNCRFSMWSVPQFAYGTMWSTVRLR